MNDRLQTRVRSWMRGYTAVRPINATSLAEKAAEEFDIDEELDDPESWLWDLAAQEATEI